MSLLRACFQGAPGSGKTSLLVGALNSGKYKVVLYDFDNCVEPLYAYVKPECLSNLTVVPFEDEFLVGDGEGLTRNPKAIKQFERFLFTGRTPDGRDLGKPATWGPDTIQVLDTITALGECCEARALALNASTRQGHHLWEAAKDQEEVCKTMISRKMHSHAIVFSHTRLISPKAETGYKDETELQIKVKKERAKLEESGFFPTIVTPGMARTFIRHFPFSLLCEEDQNAKNPSKRVVRTVPVQGYQIKSPIQGLADKLPIETALVTLLDALT